MNLVLLLQSTTLFSASVSVIKSRKNEVRDEEGCGAINPDCSDTACCCGHSRGAAAEEDTRIGYLAGDPRSPSREAFRQGLKDLGYLEGQNILIEWRYAEDKPDRFPELATELVRLKVDAIVAANAAAVGALKRATTTIPIVVASYGGDLVADGIVASYARPGGNITGVTPLDPELSGRQIGLLKETLPKLSRLAVTWKPDDSGSLIQYQQTQASAAALGIQLMSVKVQNSGEIDKAIREHARGGAHALLVKCNS